MTTSSKLKLAQPTAKVEDKEQSKIEPLVLDEMSLEELVDAYGDYQDRATALLADPVFARVTMLKKELLARVEAEIEPSDSCEVTGTHYLVKIGARSRNSREMLPDSIPKILELLGEDTFLKLAKVGIGDLDKYLTPEEVATVTHTPEGYKEGRTIKPEYLG